MSQQPHYRLLAALQLAAGVVTLPFGILGLDPRSWHVGEMGLGLLWWLLALFTGLVAPRTRTWALDLSLCLSVSLLGLGSLITDHPSVQILNGIGMILIGVFAAYTLPLARIVFFLFFSVTVFIASAALTRVLAGVWVAVVVVAMLVFNTLHVYFLVGRLRESSLVDPLTGALNRNGLTVKAPAVRAVAGRAGRPTAVAFIDLDKFKEVNDTLGHAHGDAVLVELARAWSNALRSGDQLARVGGDEFVVVLPDCDLAQAESLLARLRATSNCAWTVGVVLWETDESDVFSAVRRADAQMYRSKRGT
jgi:diguanylate cyclase (GGDEF)-like protein